MQRNHGLDGGTLVVVEVAAGVEVRRQRPGLVSGPGLEGGDELGLVDQAVLKGQQAEEQVAVGVDGHGTVSRGGGRLGEGPGLGGGPGIERRARGLSHVLHAFA